LGSEAWRLMWGKTDKDQRDRYHPLLFHLLDAANVACLLWSRVLGEPEKAAVAGDLGLEGERLEAVVAFLAGLHDLGKATPAFQRQRPDLALPLEGLGLHLGSGEPKPHSLMTAHEVKRLIEEPNFVVTADRMTAKMLSQLTAAHHGVFPDAADLINLRCDSLGDERWHAARRWMAEALWGPLTRGVEVRLKLSEEPQDPQTVPVLAGLISVADWVGSNPDYFCAVAASHCVLTLSGGVVE